MAQTPSKQANLKPSDYLRARRPERYSDSITIAVPQLTSDLLEYHLETLTSRSQEKEFEHFARCLAEKELCPNLLPQTGPTGGGDSKVDTETYPVAESIAMRWYQGDAGAKERWAFAMSAKRDWCPKVKSDVKKIANTDREYSLIYFITNQFVPDKKRAEVEDTLKKEFGIPIRILDRSWIVDRVIEHDCKDIVVKTLAIDGLTINPTRKIGPRDAQREIELEELDKEIKNTDRYVGTEYQLAEDCLRSAILASNLEKNRYEVDGRFAAALRVAEGVGDQRQILRVIYKHAWSSCFVYNDTETLSNLYDKVENLALASDYADDIEMVQNLFNVLAGCIKFGQITPEIAKIEERSKRLKDRLIELSNDDNRLNNAHSARTRLCIHDLTMSRFNKDGLSDLDEIFSKLNDIFKESRGLGQYPFDSFKQIICELGNIFPENENFEKLYDTVVTLIEERTSEGEAGSAITDRGIQKFRAGKIYDAIKLFGRAQEKLVKDEYKHELIKSLVVCGGAYKSAGLFWAARSNLLSALSITLFEFNRSGFMHELALLAAKELIWIEIQLGRVPHILFTLTLINFVALNMKLNDEEEADLFDFIQHADTVFSMLLLRLNLDQLKEMTRVPYILDQMSLFCSEGSLLFAFGNIDKFRNDFWSDKNKSDEKIEEFFELLSSQPANEDLPEIPEIGISETISLRSKVLGCNLTVQANNNPNSILISETLLAALESFLATSLESEIMPYKKYVNVLISRDSSITNNFGIEVRKNTNSFDIEIAHKDDFDLNSPEKIKKFRVRICEFIASILPIMAIIKNSEAYFKQLVEEENVFGRSLIFSDVVTVSNNVFGSLEWISLSDWSKSVAQDAYTIERKKQWKPSKLKEQKKETLKYGKDEPPEQILSQNNLRHGDRKILSVIDIPKWNTAKWTGSFFMIYPEGRFPPCLGLLFKDEHAARNIFEGWHKDIGKEDTSEQIRVCILTGVDNKNPPHYRLHIGSNIAAFEPELSQRQVLMVSRILTMTPDSTQNLDVFLEAYKQYKAYFLVPAIYKEKQSQPKVLNDLLIFKKELHIRPAWEVDINDDDLVALQLDDQPIIPTNIKDPPVLRALARKKAMKSG